MDEQTTKQDYNRNPEGKGGFQERPEDINKTGRPKHGISYWMNHFLAMSNAEFIEQEKLLIDMPMSAGIAYERVKRAKGKLSESQEVTNRTDGLPKQTIEHGLDDSIGEVNINIKRNEKNG